MEEHPTVEDFARFLQQSPRAGDANRNALVVHHLLRGCAECRKALQEVRGAAGFLPRLLEIPSLCGENEPAISYDYSWSFAKAERAFKGWLVGGCPPERGPERLAELAGLSDGEQIRQVSAGGRFADPRLILCLIERSHSARYRNPRKTLHLARLAQLAAEACTSKVTGGDAQLADLRTRAWMQYGNALRISGRPREAEEAFTIAQRHGESGTDDPRLRAWMLEKSTPLATLQSRFEDAIRMCEEAGAIYRELGERHLLASTLVQKSTAFLYSGDAESAIGLLNQAIPLIDSEEDPHLLLAANHNLATCYIDIDCPEEALALHYAARPLYQECKDPLNLLRAIWQEGNLLREIGHLHSAEASLLRARQGFSEQGLAYEAGLVSLDLVEVFSKLGKSDELRQVITEATPIFRALGLSREVLASQLLQQRILTEASPLMGDGA